MTGFFDEFRDSKLERITKDALVSTLTVSLDVGDGLVKFFLSTGLLFYSIFADSGFYGCIQPI